MNSSRNNGAAHERARRLIALAGPDTLSATNQLSTQSSNAWLAAHLETCASCRAFAENAAEMVSRSACNPKRSRTKPGLDHATKGTPPRPRIAAPSRTAVAGFDDISCAVVTLCALLSAVILWRGFEWLGTRAHLASSVWQVGFLVFCMMPALVVAILLLAKDRHLANHSGSYEG